MPQELMFNELCVRHEETRLTKPLENAIRWLRQFSQLLSLLSRYKNISELRVPIAFRGAYLVNGYHLGRLLSEEESLIEEDHRLNIKRFTDRGKYLEDIEEITDDEGLFQHREDLYMFRHVRLGEYCRGFGAAHLLDALAISIDTEEDSWDCEVVEVEKQHNSGNSTVMIHHACQNGHLNLPTRIFERNPKHDLVVERDYIAKLDLDDEEAQAILNLAAQPDRETRFYGYSNRTKRFYVFPTHTAGHYHAYPVDRVDTRIRKQVLRQLNDLNVIDDATTRRLMRDR